MARQVRASDGAGGIGPLPPTDVEGTNVDEHAMAPDTTSDYEIMLPFTRRSCSECLRTARGNFMALRIHDEIRHASEYHNDRTLTFKCTGCQKQYRSKHAAECHVPKCTGPPLPQNYEFRCNDCGMSFKKKVGLSQHQRHRHPLTRNEARAVEAAPVPILKAPRGMSNFSLEEYEMLVDLEERFRGEWFINKLISQHLPGKTPKQISDKRREVGYMNFRDARRAQARRLLEEDPLEVPDASGEPTEVIDQTNDTDEFPPHPQPIISVEIPEINILNATQDSAPPENTRWREEIINTVLARQLPKKAISAEQADLVRLLKSALLYANECDGQVPQAHIDHVYDALESYFTSNCRTRGGQNTRQRSSQGRSRGETRRHLYARTQDLYKKNPGLVAKNVREKVDWFGELLPMPPPGDFKELYTTLWGTKPKIQTPVFEESEEQIELSNVLKPITVPEIKRRISNTKPTAAAGPDGLERKHLANWFQHESLHLLFNFLLCCGRQPTQWRDKNRTILIRKEGKPHDDANNYRPITISSLLCRLYWGIIDQKLRQVVRYNPRQKGFIAESGCYNNVHILNELLRHSKRNQGLVVVQLDLSKAFDTLPHQAIGPALRRKGLPELVVQLVEDQYKDVHTNIQCQDDTIRISLQRGVKQGDPLSPFIFNAVMEPLLHELEKMSGYQIKEGTSVSSLAFADDIILTATDVPRARQLLGYTEAYLSGLGMTLAATKSACFRIIKTKDSWYLADPDMTLSSGEAIPFADADTRLSYLGMRISPWEGLTIESIEESLCSTLKRVKKLALKPYQKVDLISTYLVPHYLYQLVVAVPPITLLRRLDQELRVVIRDIYHLPQCVANGLIYCGKRDGGLGFPKLEVVTVAATLRAGYRFIHSTDPVMQALAEDTGMVNRLKSLANSVRINWPLRSLKDLNDFKMRSKKIELARWSELIAQGKSVKSLSDDRIANAWLFNPKLLKPCRFITALRLRTNTAANRAVLERAGPIADSRCRKCKCQRETLAHILGQCVYTKPWRIRRHDDIVNFVVAKVVERDPRAAVTKEPVVRLPLGGNLKPDLVVENQGRVNVVDVTVRHEDNEYLAQGRLDKLQKYSRLLPQLQRETGASSGKVLPIVVGTRGAMPKETVAALAELNIKDRNSLLTISLMALRSSIEIYHMFMDYDGPALVGEDLGMVRPDPP